MGDTAMGRLRSIRKGLAMKKLLLAVGVWAGLAGAVMARTVEDRLVEELKSQGYVILEDGYTFLGRLRIVAENGVIHREIVVNPGTGEVLRDYAVQMANLPAPGGNPTTTSSGNSGSNAVVASVKPAAAAGTTAATGSVAATAVAGSTTGVTAAAAGSTAGATLAGTTSLSGSKLPGAVATPTLNGPGEPLILLTDPILPLTAEKP